MSGATAVVVPRYAVVGHPVAHSLSPRIHRAFAAQTGSTMAYDRLLAPLDGFGATVARFFDDGGLGLNVTVPFKREAFVACDGRLSERARRAGAVNLLVRDAAGLTGDNVDGAGLVVDLARLAERHGFDLADAETLVVGAGGAGRGIVGPLVDAGARVTVVNRDAGRARALVAEVAPSARIATFDALAGRRFGLVINATSVSLGDASLPLPPSVFADAALAYDLMYAAEPTRFLVDARAGGARLTSDGLGMLVEQAAASFAIWRGVRPDTGPVLDALRAALAGDGPAT